jgi:hypothetical protein
LGCRVLKVDETDVADPSGPLAAMESVYAVDGRNSSLLRQVPSSPAFPVTLTPWVSTSVTVLKEPDDTLTVTGVSGRTLIARSAGETSSTAGVASGVAMALEEAR